MALLQAPLDVGGAGHIALLLMTLLLPLAILLGGREGGSAQVNKEGGREGGREVGKGHTSIWKAELETTRTGTPTPLVPGSDLP